MRVSIWGKIRSVDVWRLSETQTDRTRINHNARCLFWHGFVGLFRCNRLVLRIIDNIRSSVIGRLQIVDEPLSVHSLKAVISAYGSRLSFLRIQFRQAQVEALAV